MYTINNCTEEAGNMEENWQIQGKVVKIHEDIDHKEKQKKQERENWKEKGLKKV